MRKKTPQKSNLVVSAIVDYLTETGDEKILPAITEELHSLVYETLR